MKTLVKLRRRGLGSVRTAATLGRDHNEVGGVQKQSGQSICTNFQVEKSLQRRH